MDALSRSLDVAAYDYLRQIAWIQKDETGVDDELWRPLKVHKMSAKKRIERNDNQVILQFFLVGAHSSSPRKAKIGKILTNIRG